jgi:hypothetical protein
MSNIRLNSNKQVAAVLDITKRFAIRGYNFIHNSTINSRGVGILISSKLPYTIHNQYCDIECNIIILDITIKGKRLTIGSVYGPNNDNEEFFNTVRDTSSRLGSEHIILGDDWKTSVDASPVRHNIDTFNMVDIPSRHRSTWLDRTCTTLKLLDPYRFFYQTEENTPMYPIPKHTTIDLVYIFFRFLTYYYHLVKTARLLIT